MSPLALVRPSPLLLAVHVLVLAACEQGVIVDSPCEINSDCVDPLVCRDGRCAIECVSQRDCIIGAHCAMVDEIGRCQIDVPLDTTTSPCGPGRECFDESIVCRAFTCWNSCTTQEDCAADSFCRQGVCANPASVGYGVHVACDAGNPCGVGEVCARHAGSDAACYRTCAADSECTDIASTTLCAEVDDPSLDLHTTVCIIGCDPVRQQGCLGTNRCEVSTELEPGAAPDYATFFECRGDGGTGGQGDRCGTDAPDYDFCERGLGCVFAGSDGPSRFECRRYCTTDGDCMGAGLACTGAAPDVVRNLDVVGGGALHVCVPAA